MTIREGGNGNGTYGTDMTFSGLMVYDVTTEQLRIGLLRQRGPARMGGRMRRAK
jgi:hypothetical protein